MSKSLVYLMGAAISAGLVGAFGWTVLALFAVLALATLVFSNEPAEGTDPSADHLGWPEKPLRTAPAI
jgi:hypothetical protein